jgi:predicted MPP superfamily phosphohydrolase
MRIAWCSDLHLCFAAPRDIQRFLEGIRNSDAEMLVVCGDISGGGHNLAQSLDVLEVGLGVPVRLVLGNHDIYRLSFAEAHRIVRESVANSVVLRDDMRMLSWLSDGVMEDVGDSVLIGHDGWYDARAGLLRNRVILNDFHEIGDFSPLSAHARVPESLLMEIRRVADESAAYLDMILPQALARRRKVVLATHVPPFPQAAWHEGRQSGSDYLPFFCSVCVGNVLVKHMEANLDKELLVLCGHTHGEGEAQILPNLKVLTAGAEYGKPRLQGVIEV